MSLAAEVFARLITRMALRFIQATSEESEIIKICKIIRGGLFKRKPG
jgi:hypothetical protein